MLNLHPLLQLFGLSSIIIDNSKSKFVIIVGGERLVNWGSLLFVGEEEDFVDVKFISEFLSLGYSPDDGRVVRHVRSEPLFDTLDVDLTIFIH